MSDVNGGNSEEAAAAGSNYANPPFGVHVSFPESVTIRMVDASGLGDYEFSLLISGFCCNAAVGFLVSAMTIPAQASILWIMTTIFAILTTAFAIWAFLKRRVMNKRAKTVKITSANIQ